MEELLKKQAHDLGFDLVGIAPAVPADGFDRLRDWLARGFGGEMTYLTRHAEAHRHPRAILADVKSVVMVGMNYFPGKQGSERDGPDTQVKAKVARYAQGNDYHGVLRKRLKELLAWVQGTVPGTHGRAVVDTAPLLERDFARRAGLGWFGKNTMLLNKRLGSFFFLGGLLLDLELQAEAPFATSHCGTCTACLDACPTGAFVSPYQLDSRLCISYLTIELRGSIASDLRPKMGDWLFGCDICQEVCPWNRKAPGTKEAAFQPRPDLEAIDPGELLDLSPEDFRRRFQGTALTRPGRAGLLRNAALVLGNTGDARHLPVLHRSLKDPDPLVAEAAAWALEQIQERFPEKG